MQHDTLIDERNMDPSPPIIFFSYGSPDQSRVLPFFDFLDGRDFDPWIDCRRIEAGQNWDFEIRRALDKASLVLVFLSNNSVSRRGYVQRELRLALDKQAEKLDIDIYIIPILLDDDVVIPEVLKEKHYILDSDPKSKDQLLEAIHYQLDALGEQAKRVQQKESITWGFRTIREEWDGAPGYEL